MLLVRSNSCIRLIPWYNNLTGNTASLNRVIIMYSMNTVVVELTPAMGFLEVMQLGVVLELLGDLAQEDDTLLQKLKDQDYVPTDLVAAEPAKDCACTVKYGTERLYLQYDAKADVCYIVLDGVVWADTK